MSSVYRSFAFPADSERFGNRLCDRLTRSHCSAGDGESCAETLTSPWRTWPNCAKRHEVSATAVRPFREYYRARIGGGDSPSTFPRHKGVACFVGEGKVVRSATERSKRRKLQSPTYITVRIINYVVRFVFLDVLRFMLRVRCKPISSVINNGPPAINHRGAFGSGKKPKRKT